MKKVRRLHLRTVDVQSLHSGNQHQTGAIADTVNLWLERLRTNAVDKESVTQKVDILENCVCIQKYSNCALEIRQILGMTVRIPVHLPSAKLLTDNLAWKCMFV